MGWFGEWVKQQSVIILDPPTKKVINNTINNYYYITMDNKIMKVSESEFKKYIEKKKIEFNRRLLE